LDGPATIVAYLARLRRNEYHAGVMMRYGYDAVFIDAHNHRNHLTLGPL